MRLEVPTLGGKKGPKLADEGLGKPMKMYSFPPHAEKVQIPCVFFKHFGHFEPGLM